MGLFDAFKSADEKKIIAQQKRIEELEEAASRTYGELQELQQKFQEAAQLISYLAGAQQQMASDMQIIYENIQAVSSVLMAEDQASDDKYFTWRWNINDDDDDLPNQLVPLVYTQKSTVIEGELNIFNFLY